MHIDANKTIAILSYRYGNQITNSLYTNSKYFNKHQWHDSITVQSKYSGIDIPHWIKLSKNASS